MEILNLLSPDQFKIFLLVLMRVSAVLFLFPFFGSKMFPPLVKAGLAFAMALVLFPIVPVTPEVFPQNSVDVLIVIFSEFFIGMALGLTVNMFIAAVQLAGQLVGVQMGFTIINVLDPQSGENMSVMDEIGYWVVLLVFLALNGHHVLLAALVDSFTIVKSGFIHFQPALLNQLLSLAADIFVLGVKIGAPAVAALLFTSAAFGVAAKFVPQMNILIVAFPLKIVIGLFFFGISLQIIAMLTPGFVRDLKSLFTTMLLLIGG